MLSSELYTVAAGPLAHPPEDELKAPDPLSEEAERVIAEFVLPSKRTPIEGYEDGCLPC